MSRPSTFSVQTFVLAVVLALLAAVPAMVFAEAPKVDLARFDYGLRARALADGVYVVEGANDDFTVANGCNIINTGFITTGAGVVVVNTGTSKRYGEQMRALIARTTQEPVVQVVQLNLHPDYFLGNQGFADVPRAATPVTRAGVAREAASYETNLYRLCGDWMLGTETVAPDRDTPAAPATGDTWQVGARTFELREFSGHTASDLVLIDRTSGVAFVGGLVFVQRIPTTPHAQIGPWLQSLDALDALNLRVMVPSHGPVQTTPEAARDGIAQTRRFLQWIDQHFSRWAAQGWEMNEVLRAPVPAEFRDWAAFRTEYVRNVAHLYPVYERQVLAPATGSSAGR
jgi:quinoprotein relay system zinc metallohydrolase 1